MRVGVRNILSALAAAGLALVGWWEPIDRDQRPRRGDTLQFHRTTITAVLAAIALVVGVILVAIGIGAFQGNEVGTEKGGQKVPAAEEGVKPPAESEQGEDPDSSVEAETEATPTPTEADYKKDVTIKSCRVGDPYSLGDRMITVDVEIKNTSASEVSDYLWEVEATDSSGNRIETILGSATNVSPGQTVNTGSGDGEEDASGIKDNVTGLDKCQLISVYRSPSTE